MSEIIEQTAQKKRLGLTVKTKTVSGFQIVTGFSELSREPRATRIINEKPVMEFPVYKELVEAMQRKSKHVVNYQAALKGEKDNIAIKEAKVKELATREAEKPSLKGVKLNDCECLIADCGVKIKLHEKKIAAFNGKYKDGQAAAKLVDDELIEIGGRFKKEKDDHFRDNPVFCEPGRGQLIDGDIMICVADENGEPVTKSAGTVDSERAEAAETAGTEYNSMIVPDGITVDQREVDGEMVDGLVQIFGNKSDNEQISIMGTSVWDFRGIEYYYKDNSDVWNKSELITDLGVKKSTVVTDEKYEEIAKTWDELTSDEREEWRFQNLTEEQKAEEYGWKKSGLASTAQDMENDLKFNGDVDYQSKAQASYDEALAALKLKYGVTE